MFKEYLMKKIKFKKKWIVIAIVVILVAVFWIKGQNASKNVMKTDRDR